MAKKENQYEAIANLLAADLVSIVNGMPESPTAPGKVKLTGEEQRLKYQQMRDDPQAWADIVAKHGREGAFLYWKEMEHKGYGDETSNSA
jgi:hypothetical protein